MVAVLDRPAPRLEIVSKGAWIPEELDRKLRDFRPKSDLGQIVKDCFSYLPPELAAELVDRITRTVVIEASLGVVTFHRAYPGGPIVETRDYGITSRKLVTDTGVAFLVDAMQGIVEPELLKFHGIGTGATAEAASQTALVTELTTQYNPDSTRATGSLTEASASVFRTVGTNTVDAGVTVQEHGIFSQAATGGGTMLDRSLTGGNALSSGDSIQTTYDLTIASGG